MLSSIVSTYSLYLVLTVFSLLIMFARGWARCVHTLHMLQLDSYLSARLLRWLWAMPCKRLFERQSGFLLFSLLGVLVLLHELEVMYGAHFVLGTWCATGSILLLRSKRPKAKKPLVYTARAIRIFALTLLISIAVAGTFGHYVFEKLFKGLRFSNEYGGAAFILLAGLTVTQISPLATALANLVLTPVQATINAYYIHSARRRLRQFAPIVVGITGSYGKTSTKYFLHTLLGERYCVLKTPQSFNTIMSVCRVINNDLKSQHKIFIVEVGAYHRGDIQKLSDLVRPQIGVITAIGPQHLERFRTIENIEATKYELVESLPKSGIAVFNNDDWRCRRLADKANGVKVLRYGLDNAQHNLTLWAEEIISSVQGLSFTLVNSEGHRIATNTVLIGRHNVLNILAAACVALEMGLPLGEVARAIPKIQPVPHRLQLLQGAAGTTIIDDSYSSNPVGAREALEALREFKTGRRVLVTPGMVELGEDGVKQNEELGANAAKICDYVLLVGPKQTRAIMRGLERERFPRERICVVRDLTEATSELQHITRSGDVVLFENDLPDLYAET